MPRPKSPLTEFILSLSSTLPAAEVVEKAKAAGFTTNPENVTQVRSRARAAAAKGTNKGAPKKTATKTPAPAPVKKTAAKPAPPAAKAGPRPKPLAKTAAPPAAKVSKSQTKSEFIRSLPVSLSVNEVVARAKAAGHDLRPHLVYEVRRVDRLRRGRSQKPAKGATVAVQAKLSAAPKPVAEPRGDHSWAETPKPSPAAHGSTENLLRAIAAEVGLARSIEILTAQRQGVLRVLGG